MDTLQLIRKHLAERKLEREKFVEQANAQLNMFNGAIQQLEELEKNLSREAEGKSQEEKPQADA